MTHLTVRERALKTIESVLRQSSLVRGTERSCFLAPTDYGRLDDFIDEPETALVRIDDREGLVGEDAYDLDYLIQGVWILGEDLETFYHGPHGYINQDTLFIAQARTK